MQRGELARRARHPLRVLSEDRARHPELERACSRARRGATSADVYSDGAVEQRVHHWQMSWGGREWVRIDDDGRRGRPRSEERGRECPFVSSARASSFAVAAVTATCSRWRPSTTLRCARTCSPRRAATCPRARGLREGGGAAPRRSRQPRVLISLAAAEAGGRRAKWWADEGEVRRTGFSRASRPHASAASCPDSSGRARRWRSLAKRRDTVRRRIRSDGWGVGLEWRPAWGPARNPAAGSTTSTSARPGRPARGNVRAVASAWRRVHPRGGRPVEARRVRSRRRGLDDGASGSTPALRRGGILTPGRAARKWNTNATIPTPSPRRRATAGRGGAARPGHAGLF